MRKVLFGMLVLGGVVGAGGRAGAWQYGHTGPWATSAAFPCANPPGWYTNTYSYAWYYPWFAYYNYSHGPYANWMAGQGFATYATCPGGPGGGCGAGQGAAGVMAPPAAGGCTVTVNLPADARLLFNGTPAAGTGTTRTFAVPPLQPGRDYGYDLTAEVVRDGRVQTVTERLVVRAGQPASVTLNPGTIQTAGAR